MIVIFETANVSGMLQYKHFSTPGVLYLIGHLDNKFVTRPKHGWRF